MAREATWYGIAPGGSVLYLPFYGVSSCAVNVVRVDNANMTGDVFSTVVIPKTYDYDSEVGTVDGPTRLYGLPTVAQDVLLEPAVALGISTTAAPKESYTGRALTRAGNALVFGNYTVQRLQGKYLMIPPGSQLIDAISGIMSVRDGAGLPWTVRFWVYRGGGTSFLYYEANAGVTADMYIAIDGSGHVNVAKVGGTGGAFTDTAVVPLSQWAYVGVHYDGANIWTTINGAQNASQAYTHGSGVTGGVATCNINNTGSTCYVQSLDVLSYATAVNADARVYNNIAGAGVSADYYDEGSYHEGGGMGQASAWLTTFTNTAVPQGFSGTSLLAVESCILPLIGVGRLQFNNGVYRYEIHTEELEL